MKYINKYTCSKGHVTITTAKPLEGTGQPTSMFISCPKCGFDFDPEAKAISQFFNVDQSLTPDYEFFLPKNIKEVKQGIIDMMGKKRLKEFDEADFQFLIGKLNMRKCEPPQNTAQAEGK